MSGKMATHMLYAKVTGPEQVLKQIPSLAQPIALFTTACTCAGGGNDGAVMVSFYRDFRRKYIPPLLPDTIFRLSTHSSLFFP